MINLENPIPLQCFTEYFKAVELYQRDLIEFGTTHPEVQQLKIRIDDFEINHSLT